jgi:predicted transglutaminase-like cysteine proteinase
MRIASNKKIMAAIAAFTVVMLAGSANSKEHNYVLEADRSVGDLKAAGFGFYRDIFFGGQELLNVSLAERFPGMRGSGKQTAPEPSANAPQPAGIQANRESEPQSPEPLTVAVDTAPGVFGSVAISFSHLNMMARWKPILAQVASDALERCFGRDECPAAEAPIQRAVMAIATVPDLVDKLQLINTAVNRTIGYQSDHILYGVTDYWAKPSETLLRGKGDCEDFAILKMAALHEAGIPVDSMSIVVLRDRRRGFFHAVLAVSTTRGDFILDILNSRVRLDRSYPDYQPLYSIAGGRAWIHGYPTGSKLASNAPMTIDVAPGTGPAGSLPAEFLGGEAASEAIN